MVTLCSIKSPFSSITSARPPAKKTTVAAKISVSKKHRCLKTKQPTVSKFKEDLPWTSSCNNPQLLSVKTLRRGEYGGNRILYTYMVLYIYMVLFLYTVFCILLYWKTYFLFVVGRRHLAQCLMMQQNKTATVTYFASATELLMCSTHQNHPRLMPICGDG